MMIILFIPICNFMYGLTLFKSSVMFIVYVFLCDLTRGLYLEELRTTCSPGTTV
jgi:hypothetical protein